MIVPSWAVEFASSLSLRPGYHHSVEPNGLVLVWSTAPNAFRPEIVKDWYWSYLLEPDDLMHERALLRRLVLGLVEHDLHEHLEFIGLVNPHRDPYAIDITLWPAELRVSADV